MSGNHGEATDLVAMLATMTTSTAVGLDLVEVVGELIAEDARFNKWVFSRKADSTAVELWNLAALASKHAEGCTFAWNAFLAASGESRHTKYRELVELLRGYRAHLQEIRQTGVVDFRDPDMPAELLEL